MPAIFTLLFVCMVSFICWNSPETKFTKNELENTRIHQPIKTSVEPDIDVDLSDPIFFQ